MEFVNDTGIKYFIDAFKRWFINNINNWWKLLKVGHNYIDKGQWDYDVLVIANTDEETKKQYPLVPKITFNSTDWIYSKWNETNSSANFPIALVQDPSVQTNGRYESSYTEKVTVSPMYGNIDIYGNLIIDKALLTPEEANILLADGSVKPSSYISPFGIIDMDIDVTTSKTIQITMDQYNMLNGYGMGYDVSFINANGIILKRNGRYHSEQEGWNNSNFSGFFYSNNKLKRVSVGIENSITLRVTVYDVELPSV